MPQFIISISNHRTLIDWLISSVVVRLSIQRTLALPSLFLTLACTVIQDNVGSSSTGPHSWWQWQIPLTHQMPITWLHDKTTIVVAVFIIIHIRLGLLTLTCLAFDLPLVSLCLAAMQRMWSSNKNLAVSRGIGLARCEDGGLCILMCKHRLSSLSPVTSTS